LDINEKVMKDSHETAWGKNMGQTQSLYRNRLRIHFNNNNNNNNNNNFVLKKVYVGLVLESLLH
jgi:hypothetical protein